MVGGVRAEETSVKYNNIPLGSFPVFKAFGMDSSSAPTYNSGIEQCSNYTKQFYFQEMKNWNKNNKTGARETWLTNMEK